GCDIETGATDDQPVEEVSQHPQWFHKLAKHPTLDRAWNNTLPATHGRIQPWISNLAMKADSHTSFNELMDTPVDFSAFVINRLKVDTLTPELLASPIYELIKGSCKSLVELEFFLEEVYKATTNKLDWNNPKGQQYPHDLLKPLPLIPNSQGRRVIPFDHFINNDLEYLRGGASSQKIIAVTELQIVEWHNYKHLDWITLRRDDAKLYKFKEGDFKRLRIQDIKDMLLLLVQGKLTNLTVDERFAFNISLRMFTRSIIIQRRVEDLQLCVKSYQKKLNLVKPETYRSDLKRKEANTAYSNPRGFIYQNKDKQNRLMCIDELDKFSDGILNDVRTALDDRLKGIQMHYVPQTFRDEDYDGIPKRPTVYLNLWSYKAVRHRYLNLMIQPELKGSTQGYPLVSVEVFRMLKDGGEGCALLRKKFKEDMFTYCIENGIFQDFQDTFEPSNDNTNVVNALQEPFVVKQDPDENSTQSPLQINHHCCYGCGDPLEDIFCRQCTCELCGKGTHYGYNCSPKVPIIPNLEPFNNQTIDELPQTLLSFDLTCYSGDGNSFTYDSKSNLVDDSPSVFNHPPQTPTYSYKFCGNDAYYFSIIHQPIREKMYAKLLAEEQEANINTQLFQHPVIPQPPQEEIGVEFLQEKRNQIDYVKTFLRKFNRICFYEMPKVLSLAWEKILEIEHAFEDKHCQPKDNLELFQRLHNDVQNIHKELAVYINTSSWDRPTICYNNDDDEDSTIIITPKEPDNSLSMGDEHLDTLSATKSDEFIKSSVENLVPNPSDSMDLSEHEYDVPACDDFTTFSNLLFDVDDNFSSSDDQSFCDEDISKKIYSNPLFDEEIISIKIDLHHFNVESDLIESLLNQDSLIISSSKIDSLLDEFADKLTFLKSIPPGINETNCDPEEEPRLIKRLLIKEDDYDSERDILILEELLGNDPLSLPENESFHFDIPSSSRPLAKPPDGNSGILNVKVMGDIFEHNVPMPRLMLTQPTLVPNQEKSPNLLSHLGHKASQPSTECSMMIYGRNIPIWMFHFSISIPLDKLK
nr:hypothetical protein [Tanacetum cinerariifolium]